MTLSLNDTFPQVIGDSTDPINSYLDQDLTVLPGQLYFNFSSGDVFCIKDCSDQTALVWNKLYGGSSSLATVATSGSYTDLINTPVSVYSSPNFSSITSATQLSSTRDADIVYVFPVTMTSLLTSQSVTATLQYADDSGMTTNVITACLDVISCSGVLNLTVTGTLKVNARIPAGKYRKVTLSETGGATIPTTISSSQEVLVD